MEFALQADPVPSNVNSYPNVAVIDIRTTAWYKAPIRRNLKRWRKLNRFHPEDSVGDLACAKYTAGVLPPLELVDGMGPLQRV